MASSPSLVFPISPPSSGNVSPCTDYRAFRNSRSLTSARQPSNQSDSEGYSTEASPPLRKRPMSRAVTLPSTPLPFTRPKSAKSLLRTPSLSGSDDSASASSTPTDGEDIAPPSHNCNPAIGRKVAASLDLFKETAEELPRSDSSFRAETVSARRTETVEDVPEAFEFVKRSEWADRENAAIRRERSATFDKTVLLEQRRASLIGSSPPDVAQWRRDVAIARGRRREREPSNDVALSAAINSLHDASVRYVPQSPSGYPPPPSPYRSPTIRQPLSYLPQECAEPLSRHLDIPTPRHSLPPSPVRGFDERANIQTPPVHSLDPISPWNTDDESNWETASATATAASNSSMLGALGDTHDRSASFLPQPPSPKDVHGTPPEAGRNSHLLPLRGSNQDNPVFDFEERLPHIPLQPFRNKVGGHSAIYKFTKQAVCKVRIVVSIANFLP